VADAPSDLAAPDEAGDVDASGDLDQPLEESGDAGTDPCAVITCAATGAYCDPAQARCACRPGYTGDGLACTPLAEDCRDDGVTDYLVCASDSKLIIVNPNIIQETPLPGCAGLVSVDVNTCRRSKSMQDEAYAVRLDFKDVVDALKDQVFYIKGYTTDNMREDDPRFRKFDVAISTIPGDFAGNDRPGCIRTGGPDGTIFAIQKDPEDPISNDMCQLTPHTMYYINVRATEPGCHDVQTDPNSWDQSSYPAHECCISVDTQILPSNP
jgi:hypothetical protein